MLSLPIILMILALVAYSTGFIYLLKHTLSKSQPNAFFVWTVLFVGLVLHGLTLSHDMITPWGINYEVFNLVSFTTGFVLLLGIVFSIYRPVLVLNLLSTPIAIVGLLMGSLLSTPNQVIRQQGLGIDLHIFLSLLAYAVLFIGAIHAILLWFQSRELKKKQKKRVWVTLLPSLQTMRSLLFDLTLIGFVLLTVALGLGFFTIQDFLGQHLAHKTAFSMLSWVIYGVLLLGHWKFGWRGNQAIQMTLIAFLVLAVGFIGSKFVLEMMLMRGYSAV